MEFTVAMQVTLESQDDFLLATSAERFSVKEVPRVFKNVIDTATKQGFEKIFLDSLAVKGERSAINLYDVGETMADTA